MDAYCSRSRRPSPTGTRAGPPGGCGLPGTARLLLPGIRGVTGVRVMVLLLVLSLGQLHGGRQVHDAFHAHQVREVLEHERGLHNTAMLDVPSRETIGVQTRDDLLCHEVPVGQEHHLRHAPSRQVAQSQIDTLIDELVVLIVTVDECDPLEAVPCELLHKSTADADDGGGIEAEGADDVVASSRPLL